MNILLVPSPLTHLPLPFMPGDTMITLRDSHLTEKLKAEEVYTVVAQVGGLVCFHEFCELVNFTMVV